MTSGNAGGAPALSGFEEKPCSNRPFFIIGNPGNRRVALFQEALRSSRLASAQVIPWQNVLIQDGFLADRLYPDSVVRIDSPGEDFDVERLVLARGAGVTDELPGLPQPGVSADECLALSFTHK